MSTAMASNGIQISDNKSQKPSSSAFKQQKLPSWSPILTVGTVLPTFFLIGVAFIPIGIGLLVSSNQVQEYALNYTACEQIVNKKPTGEKCSEVIGKDISANCECRLDFKLDEDFRRDVYFYYGLTNFYQNHRRYVKSRDDRQLLGEIKGSTECAPFDQKDDKWFAPCGAIANSLFNDTFIILRRATGIERSVPLMFSGIAWATDKNAKFRNPKTSAKNLSEAFKDTLPPPNWQTPVWNLSSDANNNGYENEALIVWMRTAALPTFRKLYGRLSHDKQDNEFNYVNGLPKGNYTLVIRYKYPVAAFKGTKRFIISNTSWLGGKNPFIGVMYIIVGCVCLLLSGIFVFIHKKFGKSTSEILNITQRTPYIG
ncbi:cell cycle control protein 50A-like [Oppia nitens]|uniref:cell cycle control protein 50A-like n=1 Tax=Oppia nitens TaxID=1686743 RepID=UPI0023DA9743|nr:cell cycle control protein 50A-like [Oppia nitens]